MQSAIARRHQAAPQKAAENRAAVGVSLAVITLAAALLRCWKLGGESLWLDEGASWFFSRMPLDALLTQRVDPGNPPLYYLMLRAWMHLLGESEAALRGLSVLAGTLSVPALYFLGRDLFGRRAGMAAALLLSLSPVHVYFSQEARAYTLVLLCGLGSALLFLRALRTDRWANWMGAALLAALAFYTHYSGLLVPIFEGIYLLLIHRGGRSLAAGGLFLLLVLPGSAFFLAPGILDANGYHYWQGYVTPAALAQMLNVLFAKPALGSDTPLVKAAAALLLAIAVGYPLWRGSRDALEERVGGERAVLFALCFVLAPFALFAVAARLKPVWQEKYLFVALPGYFLLVAWVLLSSRGRYRIMLAASLAVLTAAGFARWMTPLAPSQTSWGPRPGPYDARPNWYPWMAKQDWRGAASTVRQAAELSGDRSAAILLVMGYIHWGFDYYYRGPLPTVELPERQRPLSAHDGDAMHALLAKTARYTTLFVVLADRDDADPDLLLIRRLAQVRGPGRFRRFLGLRVFAFGKGAPALGGPPVTIRLLEGTAYGRKRHTHVSRLPFT